MSFYDDEPVPAHGVVLERGRGSLPFTLLHGEPLVADLAEGVPRALGERLAVQPRERLRRAEAGACTADEQHTRQVRTRHGSV